MNAPAVIHGGSDGLELLSQALHGYHQEIDAQRSLCDKHTPTAAIHTKGKELQLYRLFERDEATAEHLRRVTDALPSWEETLDWNREGKNWEKLERDITGRMTKHEELLPIVTKGVSWEGRPILIHAYKFEADPTMKVELVLPHVELENPELPLRTIASALRCHEHLVPEGLAQARPPYERHEAEFISIPQYLSHTMPPELYATRHTLQALPQHAHV